MHEVRGSFDGSGLRVVIIASRFNERVVKSLVDGAVDALARAGVGEDDVELAWVPGAFELPVAARVAAESGRADAVICLGAVVRGETPHFDLVAGQAATGICRVGIDTGVPVLFGVLTTDDAAQAEARAGGKAGNKGADAALAAIETVRVLESLRKERSDPAGRARSDPAGRARSDSAGRARSDPAGRARSDPAGRARSDPAG